jgi:hypothetical protein
MVNLTVGVPPPQPGQIIWGPKTCPGMPTQWGLYGVAYNPTDTLIYCAYYMSATIYKYTSDSALTSRGTVTAPEDSCTDIDYCSYDNTFWLVANSSKKVYKITPGGTVVRYFNVPQPDYPCGIVEDEDAHVVYVSDRRLASQPQQRLFVYDTAGTILDTIIHPQSGYYGSRCLALDYRGETNPPELLNMFTWFDASGTTLDSCGMLSLDRVGNTILHRYRFTTSGWNMRGIECDPRDGSYWVTIMQGGSTDNQILKVHGFHEGVGLEEERPAPVPGRAAGLQAWPSPTTGMTRFALGLVQPGAAELRIYDNTGRVVRALSAGRGASSVVWDGRDNAGRAVAPGIYFCRLNAAEGNAWTKLVMTR